MSNNNKADNTLIKSQFVQNIWDYATPQIGHNPQKCRRDMFGNLMYRKELFNDDSEFGWEATPIVFDASKKDKITLLIPVSFKSKRENLNN